MFYWNNFNLTKKNYNNWNLNYNTVSEIVGNARIHTVL